LKEVDEYLGVGKVTMMMDFNPKKLGLDPDSDSCNLLKEKNIFIKADFKPFYDPDTYFKKFGQNQSINFAEIFNARSKERNENGSSYEMKPRGIPNTAQIIRIKSD
jgi:hypothetical protein